jgi:hypothetical protein
MSSSALEQDFAESNNLGIAASEEASIDEEAALSGEAIGGLEVTASPGGWAVEGAGGSTPIAEG